MSMNNKTTMPRDNNNTVETSIPWQPFDGPSPFDEPSAGSSDISSLPFPTKSRKLRSESSFTDVYSSACSSWGASDTEDDDTETAFSSLDTPPHASWGVTRRFAILGCLTIVAIMAIGFGAGYIIAASSNSSSPPSSASASGNPNDEETTPQDPPSTPNDEETTPQHSPSTPTSPPTAAPALALVGDNGVPETSFPLGRCEGDCDDDSQCQPGLKCFQREQDEPVPGCSGTGQTGKDYCYQGPPNQQEPQQPQQPQEPPSTGESPNQQEPQQPQQPQEPPSTEGPPLVEVGNNQEPAAAFPLGLCEGDCDSDEDCQPGLKCMKREGTELVPGCSGFGISGSDYCYMQPSLEDVLATGILFGLCEGDCENDDAKCQSGLSCFHRQLGNEQVPGCDGSGTFGNDYCYQEVVVPSYPAQTPSPTELSSPAQTPSPTEPSSPAQTPSPTEPSSPAQTPSPTEALATEDITYKPGELTASAAGLILSSGLTARVIAISTETVKYHGGGASSIPFHGRPDFGATLEDTSGNNPGGWIYVSNSEMKEQGQGGVGAITFDRDGNVLNYQMVLTDTTWNCGGGRTPWNTWVSCEEVGNDGQIYQVDPLGNRQGEKLTMGLDGDRFESFAYDDRNADLPVFFATTDTPVGALRRWTPDNPDLSNPWDILHGPGKLQYLFLTPDTDDGQPIVNLGDLQDTSGVFPLSVCEGDCVADADCQEGLMCFQRTFKELVPGCTGVGAEGRNYCYDPDFPFNPTSSGRFTWIDDLETARLNAQMHFPETEGIDCVDGVLYFVSKPRRVLYVLDLDSMTFRRESTVHGLFEGAADQIQRIVADDDGDEILYFTEEREGGTNGGIHGRNAQGQFFTILEGPREVFQSESTGLAFSPDGSHLYFAFQENGVLFDVTRTDGLPFHGRSMDVNYHNPDGAES